MMEIMSKDREEGRDKKRRLWELKGKGGDRKGNGREGREIWEDRKGNMGG